MDDASLGFIRVKAGNVFVTTNSFNSPATTTASIQRGVDLASINDEVHVAAGTYFDDLSIATQGVKVIGAGAGSTTIDYTSAPGHNNGGVHISADDVELRSLSVTQTIVDSVPRYGVKVDFVDGVTIDGVTITNSFRSGLDLHGVTNMTVNDLVSQNNGGAGIFMTDVKGAALSNITTANNPWVGVSIATSGQFATLGTNGIVFSGTNSFGESAGANGGLQLEMFNFNTNLPHPISWSSNPLDNADVTIQSADFGYALSGSSFDGGANHHSYVRFYNSLAQAENAAAGSPDHIDGAGTRYIQEADDSNGLPNSGPTNFYVFDDVNNTMSVQAAVNAAIDGDTVNVAAGTFVEDVTINKNDLTLKGADPFTTILSGAIGGPGSTITVAGLNADISGFTITREGNDTIQWNDPGLNSAGIAIQGQALSGTVIHDNIITGNRTGIDINNSNDHTVRNNVIDNNRTGLIFRNQTDDLLVTENYITNNWTVGIVFLDASGGTNVPVQTAANSQFFNNDISGNWYGQVVDRQTGGSLPAPGANVKDFAQNWFGTTSPVFTTANSTEPGYAAQIPVIYGGTAVPPGGQPDIAGPASANIDVTPVLTSGTDTNVETTPGRGTFGFQGNLALLGVTIAGPATVNEGATYTLQLNPSNPGSPNITSWDIDWNDGSPIETVLGNPASVNHVFADGLDSHVITAVANTTSGPANSNSVSVTVNNVAPMIAISGSSNVAEGAVYTLTLGAITDPGSDTVTSYTVHWGDGNSDTYFTNGPVTHTYVDGPNNYNITVDLVDEDGTHLDVANALSVSVGNVDPTIAISGASNVAEGAVYTLTLGAVTDPGSDTVASYIVHWGDGDSDTYFSNGPATHTYADGPNNYNITVDLVDEDGTYLDVANPLNVTVGNVAPTMFLFGATTANNGSTLNYTFTTTDPGQDTFTFVAYSGGMYGTVSNLIFVNGAGSFDVTFNAPPGLNTTTITIQDQDSDGALSNVASLVVSISNTLQVTNFVTNPSGFDVTFNRAPDLDELNLYTGRIGSEPVVAVHAPDIVVTRSVGMGPATEVYRIDVLELRHEYVELGENWRRACR